MGKRRRTPRLVLPPRPFLVGTFGFPFSTGARGPTLVLTALSIVAGLLARESVALQASGDGRLTFLGAIFTVGTVMMTAACLAYGAASAVAIVGDTANGCDRVTKWPGPVFLDWIGESLLVVCGLGAAAAAGIGTAWLLRESGRPNDGVAVLASFLLMPVVLLSMFDNDSMFDAISPRVFRTMWTCPDAWGAFYASTALVLGTAATILALALPRGGRWGVLLSAAAFAVAWLIAFRLLGRLALVCTVRSAPVEPDDDDDVPQATAGAEIEDPMARQRDG